MGNKTTRRGFVQSSAALGTAWWVGSRTSAQARPSALEGLAAACVGVGGKGGSDTSHVAEHGVNILGLCDVDKNTLTKKAREFKDAKQFTDFREMFEAIGDKVDIVTVSTPDHTHATAAINAMKMGKHVYCQKPLTWSIHEARKMRETAAEKGVVTQMGNQGTSEDGLREAVEVLRAGAIGDVTEVHIWSNRPIWPQGVGRPEGSDPVPESLNWDAWLGPAPFRPYVGNRTYHDFNWRGWCDFGTGALGDMACHTCNTAVKGLDLWDATAITAVRNPGIFEGETYPGSSQLKFEFPARGNFVPCTFNWYDGGNLPDESLTSQLPERFRKKIEEQRAGGRKTSGALYVGSKGMLYSPDDYGAQYFLLPQDDFKDFKPPEQTIPRIPFRGNGDLRHKFEFVSAIKGECETQSNFGYAGRLTETILCGNLAIRAGEGIRVEWDAKNLKVTNLPELNKFVHREYREGWTI